MTVDKSAKWWVGTRAEDIKEYLEAYSADNYKPSEFRLAKCSCGNDAFYLFADDEEGCAKRICVSCGTEQFICDSEEYWVAASPEEWKCIECGSTKS